MCFSAGASFTAAAVLSVIGLLSVAKAPSKSYVPFAMIPLFFALQQFAEGILWKTLSDNSYATLNVSMIYTFLFFAAVVWPIWMPFSLLLIEKIQERKKILSLLVIAGITVSLYGLYNLLMYGASAELHCHHIAYTYDTYNYNSIVATLIYALPTVGSFFVMRDRIFWVFGALLGASCILSHIFWKLYSVSVWCFFAALLSAFVIMIITRRKSAH